MNRALDKIQILHMIRQIQTELAAYLGDCFRIGTFFKHQGYRIARYDLKKNKRDQADAEQYEDCLQQTFSRIRNHAFSPKYKRKEGL